MLSLSTVASAGLQPNQASIRRSLVRDLLTMLQRATQPEHGTDANSAVHRLLDFIILKHMANQAEQVIAITIGSRGSLASRLAKCLFVLDDDALDLLNKALPRQRLEAIRSAALRFRNDADPAEELAAALDEKPIDRSTPFRADYDRNSSNQLKRIQSISFDRAKSSWKRQCNMAPRRARQLIDIVECLSILSSSLWFVHRDEEATALDRAIAEAWCRLSSECPTGCLAALGEAIASACENLERSGEWGSPLRCVSVVRGLA